MLSALGPNPYRKDDRTLFAEIFTRRQRKASSRSSARIDVGGVAQADGAQEKAPFEVDVEGLLKKLPESRLRWLQKVLLQPGIDGAAVYDVVEHPKFAVGADADVRRQMREALLMNIGVFTVSQQEFIKTDPNFPSSSSTDDGHFDGAAAQAALQATLPSLPSAPSAGRSRSPSPVGAAREPSPSYAEELAARTATVRPKRAAAPPRPVAKPAEPEESKASVLHTFLAAASALPAAEPAAAPKTLSDSEVPYDPEPAPTGEPPPLQPEKKMILEGFLSALGLAPPPAPTVNASRAASDAVYEAAKGDDSGDQEATDGRADAGPPVDGEERKGVKFNVGGKPIGERGAKAAASGAVAAALSNITGAAAAARAAADHVHVPITRSQLKAEKSDGKKDKEKDGKDRDSSSGRSSSRSSRKKKSRSRSRRRRRRSSSSGGSRRRRSRSRSRDRDRDKDKEKRKKLSRLGFDDEISNSVVNASELQAAEQLAMARRMSTIQGTAGENKLRPGDWTCPICSAHNFASKFQCFRCAKAKNPFLDGVFNLPHAVTGLGYEPTPQQMKVGDWLCPRCSAHNFASKFQCFRCGQGKNPMLGDQSVHLHLPGAAQIGGRSAAGLALKAAAMSGAGRYHLPTTAAQAAHAQGFNSNAPQGFSSAPPSQL